MSPDLDVDLDLDLGLPSPDEPMLAARAATEPDVAASALSVEGLDIRATSLRGAHHEILGQPRQDAFGLLEGDGWIALGVADGVGSCRYSELGSVAALRGCLPALLDVVAGSSSDLDITAVTEPGRALIAEVGARHGVDGKDLSTTLTVAAVRTAPDPDGRRRCLVVMAGDSPVFVVDPEGAWSRISPEERG
ncbi:MAG TPA: protein phosphatase 2C domain-containing protein, partial [Iamia sp.]|nr:protein phosphatase 2C domain-containing protein [Iamia sp.]